MAGHSQFKNIMHRKGRQDAARARLFAKLAREITVAARNGLPDPEMNARLRLAMQAARAENMPKDNIERAVKKAAGADDVASDARGLVFVCAFEHLAAVADALARRLGEPASAKALWRPQQMTSVDEERAASALKLLGALEEDDDVQNVYCNFEVSDAVMAKLTAA